MQERVERLAERAVPLPQRLVDGARRRLERELEPRGAGELADEVVERR